jgi:hypothetical protein
MEQGDPAGGGVEGLDHLQDDGEVPARRRREIDDEAEATARERVRRTAVVPEHFPVPFRQRGDGQGQHAGIRANEQIHPILHDQPLGPRRRRSRPTLVVVDDQLEGPPPAPVAHIEATRRVDVLGPQDQPAPSLLALGREAAAQ